MRPRGWWRSSSRRGDSASLGVSGRKRAGTGQDQPAAPVRSAFSFVSRSAAATHRLNMTGIVAGQPMGCPCGATICFHIIVAAKEVRSP